MDGVVVILMQLLQIALMVGAVFFIFAGLAALRTYLQQKMGMQVNYDWAQILAFVMTAVKAVAQIYKTKPANLSDDEWNRTRYSEAEKAVIAYANSLGIHVDGDFLTAIRAAIEAAVATLRKNPETVPTTTVPPVYMIGTTSAPLVPPFPITS